MKKIVYLTPELEIITFVTEDVITASGGEGGEPAPTDEPYQPALPWD